MVNETKTYNAMNIKILRILRLILPDEEEGGGGKRVGRRRGEERKSQQSNF